MTYDSDLADLTDTEVLARLLKQQVNEALRVRVENKDGREVNARIENVVNVDAIDYEADWTDEYDSLYAYWAGDPEVRRGDRVIEVKWIDGGSNILAYPESKVYFHLDGSQLETVPGVGSSKARMLRQAGYGCIMDLQLADQTELADVTGIGNALAARIKADTGNLTHPNDSVEATIPETVGGAAHVGYVCPQCDDAFGKHAPNRIEGDDGTWFCSIECLNEYYLSPTNGEDRD